MDEIVVTEAPEIKTPILEHILRTCSVIITFYSTGIALKGIYDFGGKMHDRYETWRARKK